MRLPGWKALLRGARWLRSRRGPRGVILGYHRIAAPACDPLRVCVTPAHLEQHLEVLRRYATPLSLADLVAGAMSGRLPERAVAVTFDDGYLDHLTRAKPRLETHGIPATVFVTTGNPGGTFWWDAVAAIVMRSRELPRVLSLEVAGCVHEWHHDGTVDEAMRTRLLHFLLPVFEGAPARARDDALARLGAWAGPRSEEGGAPRALTTQEISLLAAGGLVSVGGHTQHHPALASRSIDEQRAEIAGGKKLLEDIVNAPVDAFAYPHGSASRLTRRLVAETGFRMACASGLDAVRRHSDPFFLPRLWVRDVDGAAFWRRLERWL